MNYNELDTSILEAFKELDTSSLTDALDKQGIAGGLLGIKAVVPGTVFAVRLYGAIYSLRSDQGNVGDFSTMSARPCRSH